MINILLISEKFYGENNKIYQFYHWLIERASTREIDLYIKGIRCMELYREEMMNLIARMDFIIFSGFSVEKQKNVCSMIKDFYNCPGRIMVRADFSQKSKREFAEAGTDIILEENDTVLVEILSEYFKNKKQEK